MEQSKTPLTAEKELEMKIFLLAIASCIIGAVIPDLLIQDRSKKIIQEYSIMLDSCNSEREKYFNLYLDYKCKYVTDSIIHSQIKP